MTNTLTIKEEGEKLMKAKVYNTNLSKKGISQPGLVHIYCGTGKGKTTTAVGLMVRAAGSGKRILFHQFMKDNSSSEIKILSQLDQIKIVPGPASIKFSFHMSADEKKQARKQNDIALKEILTLASDYDMLVLDELIYAIGSGLLDEEIMIDFLRNKPHALEVIMTGQNPSEVLKRYANYISEINKIKHPYDDGIPSRIGIEK